MTKLTPADYQNMLALLQRVPVNGLNEAKAMVMLAAKIEQHLLDMNGTTEEKKPSKTTKKDHPEAA